MCEILWSIDEIQIFATTEWHITIIFCNQLAKFLFFKWSVDILLRNKNYFKIIFFTSNLFSPISKYSIFRIPKKVEKHTHGILKSYHWLRNSEDRRKTNQNSIGKLICFLSLHADFHVITYYHTLPYISKDVGIYG